MNCRVNLNLFQVLFPIDSEINLCWTCFSIRNDVFIRSFNGKEGRPAYIAYAGNVYDVSKSGIWHDGIHFFRHPAGADLTDFLSQAPHGESNILKMPRVGKVVSPEGKKEHSKFKKIFYFLAYFNLTFVFLIILILALWRWWIWKYKLGRLFQGISSGKMLLKPESLKYRNIRVRLGCKSAWWRQELVCVILRFY